MTELGHPITEGDLVRWKTGAGRLIHYGRVDAANGAYARVDELGSIGVAGGAFCPVAIASSEVRPTFALELVSGADDVDAIALRHLGDPA